MYVIQHLTLILNLKFFNYYIIIIRILLRNTDIFLISYTFLTDNNSLNLIFLRLSNFFFFSRFSLSRSDHAQVFDCWSTYTN